eukprot:9306728-Pyramimonas_sp.AAC.1
MSEPISRQKYVYDGRPEEEDDPIDAAARNVCTCPGHYRPPTYFDQKPKLTYFHHRQKPPVTTKPGVKTVEAQKPHHHDPHDPHSPHDTIPRPDTAPPRALTSWVNQSGNQHGSVKVTLKGVEGIAIPTSQLKYTALPFTYPYAVANVGPKGKYRTVKSGRQ